MKLILILLFTIWLQSSNSIELTFKISDQSVECFHENIQVNVPVSVKFQVIAGGSHDIDCTVEGPGQSYIYHRQRIHLDTITFRTLTDGTYSVCFGNEFSTFSDKVVYMRFQVGEEIPPLGIENKTTVMTQIEASLQGIHQTLDSVLEHQTQHRLREAQGWKRTEGLNWRVTWLGLLKTLLILAACIGQVVMVKHYFSYSSIV